MLLFAAAAIALTGPQDAPRVAPAATVQATAAVRIVRAARIRFDGQRDSDTPAPRRAHIRTADGPKPAQLIEFE